MILIGLILFLVLAVAFTAICIKEDNDGAFFVAVIFWILVTALTIGAVILVSDISHAKTIDAQIELYEAENSQIEARINTLVENYMEYEHMTFTSIKDYSGEKGMDLITLFPDLKADTLVQTQIDLYTANQSKVLQLKSEKIDISRKRWLLYFGS